MYTNTMKWLSLGALLLAMAAWPASSVYQTELNLVVCAGAAFVAVQAYRAENYHWAAGFLPIVLLFNPFLPVYRLGGLIGLALVIFAIAPFAVSLAALRPTPLLSIPPDTDRRTGRQSL